MFMGDVSNYGKIDDHARRIAERIKEKSLDPKIIVYKLPESLLFARILSDALRVSNVAGISDREEISDLPLANLEGGILLVALGSSTEIEEIRVDLSSYGKVEIITPNFEVADAYRSG